jgi:molecular chaperone GrpE (heat shock protein)
MSHATELRALAGSVMKQHASARRALNLDMRSWRDMSRQTVEAFADLLEQLDTLAADASGDAGTVSYIKGAIASGWQRLAAAGITVDGFAGEEFARDRHKAIQEVETQASSARWVTQTVEHGLIMRGERIRRATVVISGRRPL